MSTTKNLATVPSIELSNAINLIAEANGEIVRLPYSLIDEKLVPLEEHMDNENNPHKLDTDDIGAATAQEVQDLKTEFSEYKISNDAELAQQKSDLNELSNMKSGAIIQTASGETIVANDSSDSPLRGLRVFGKTEQFSTTGAQLFDVSNVHVQSTMGINSVVNNDGSITVNGTPTAQYATFVFNSKLGLELGDYYISGGEKASGCVYAQIGITLSDGTIKYYTNAPFTIDGTEQKVILSIQTGSSLDAINNYTIYPMLSKGTTLLPYEPYTGGIASPNPNYPQELVSAGNDGDVEVGVYGGNLLDYNEWSNKATCFPSSSTLEWKDNGATITSVTADAYTSYSASGDNVYKIPCKPNIKYTLSWEWTGNSSDMVFVFFNGISANHVCVAASEGSLTFTTLEDTKFFTFRVGCYTAGTTSTYKNVRINLGDTALPYEPYRKQTLTALTPNGLPAIPVTDASFATYTDANGQMWCADEIDFERGVYVKRIESRRLLSTDDWSTFNANGRYWLANYKFNDLSESVFCTHFKYATSWDEHTSTLYTCIIYKDNNWSAGRLSFNTTFASLDDWKTFLSNNELYMMYQLATPIETPLSEEELTAYRALHSNYPVTTVLNDSDAHMEVKYNADTKNYIDNKFAELQTALIALGGI